MVKWLLLVILLVVFYLNRTYAYFFDYLGSHEVVSTSETVAHPYFALPLNSINTDDNAHFLALGDSLTRGVGVANDMDAYPFLVASHLSSKRRLEYTNLAIPGSTTAGLLKNQLPFLGDGNYEYLSLCIGINDVLTAIGTDQFKTNYETILNGLANHHSTIIVIDIPYLSSSKIMFPPYNFLVDFRVKQFNSIISNLVAQKKAMGTNIIYVDLYNQTKGPFSKDPELFSEDKFHPSAKGYKLWSEIINGNLNI